VLSEAVNRIKLFISIFPTVWVTVGILFFDHLSFLIVEKLEILIHVFEPRMTENLLTAQSFVWINFKKTTQKISSFWRYIVF
jgi:hypothetical protein